MNHEAIYALYPTVRSVDASGIAKDVDENPVSYDLAAVNAWVNPNAYITNRTKEYPPITDYLDAVVKGDQAQIDKYIADCLAIKTKYPKPE
jgi:hypothetical protein